MRAVSILSFFPSSVFCFFKGSSQKCSENCVEKKCLESTALEEDCKMKIFLGITFHLPPAQVASPLPLRLYYIKQR